MSELRTLLRNNKSLHYEKVRQIMEHFGQTINDVPVADLTDKDKILRARLIFEEVLEKIQDGLGVDIVLKVDADSVAMNYGTATIPLHAVKEGHVLFVVARPFDIVETVDGCFDAIVVATGTLIACGVPDMDGQDLVDEANLAKFGGGKDEFGKYQKPPGWKPADIAGWINRLEAEAEQFPIGSTTATLNTGSNEEESE